MFVMVIKYPVKMSNYSSREDVVLSLNDISNIKAEYISEGIGKGYIQITFSTEVTPEDILSLGAYIGQIETMGLI